MPGQSRQGMLELEEFRAKVKAGEFHTVVLAMVDMQGRLQGKRLSADYFLNEVVNTNAEGCNYQLAVDVEMNTVSGYEHASWESGYGDFVFVPDLATLRQVPWQEGSALVICDLCWHDGNPVRVSPRQILQQQIDRLHAHGLQAFAGTELEFIVFRESYEQAWDMAYRGLTPANRYNVDYSLLDTAGVEPLLTRIRLEMAQAGLVVLDSKGECNFGQHEVNFQYGDALTASDGHSVYRNGAKEIAAQQGWSLTFMPKFNEREGSSCHIHLSIRDTNGDTVMAQGPGLSKLGEHFVAGIQAHMRDLTLLSAPNINSYKRYVPGSFAPTSVAWGRDNRTCALRLVGHGASLRIENRVPGGDVNPYLAIAGMIAAGLDGIERSLPIEPACTGNAYEMDKAQIPSSLHLARELFANSDLAKAAFGDDVVRHYLNMADVELQAFNAAVTDWERFRSFERL